MDLAVLGSTGTCDLTTYGRRSSQPRRIEIWYVVVGGRLLLTGTPGPRDWLANLRADPRGVLHLRTPPRDVRVRADEVTDAAERAQLVPLIWAAQPWNADQPYTAQDWVERSPMMVLSADPRVAPAPADPGPPTSP